MKRFKLTAAYVRAAARRAYCEQRLIAQNGGGACCFVKPIDGKDCGCAIGVALPAELRAYLAKRVNSAANFSLNTLITNGLIEADSEADRHAIADIQHYHDAWARSGKRQDEARFCGLIGAKLLRAAA